MTDAIDVLYEEIEKARGKGLVPKGGSARLRGKVLGARKKTLDRIYRSDPYSSKGIKVASPRLFPKRRK